MTFGTGIPAATPGSAQHLLLAVSDIEAAGAELVNRGVDTSEALDDVGGVFHDAATDGRLPEPGRRPYASFTSFGDADGSGSMVQEITADSPDAEHSPTVDQPMDAAGLSCQRSKVPAIRLYQIWGRFPHEPTVRGYAVLPDAAAAARKHGVVGITALLLGSTCEEIVGYAESYSADLTVVGSCGDGALASAPSQRPARRRRTSRRPMLVVGGADRDVPPLGRGRSGAPGNHRAQRKEGTWTRRQRSIERSLT